MTALRATLVAEFVRIVDRLNAEARIVAGPNGRPEIVFSDPAGRAADAFAEFALAAAAFDAVGAVRNALGDGHPDGPVRPSDRLLGGSMGVVCEACPFGGCRGCPAEVARRANGGAK